ncbi:NAD(P)-binding protein [Calocera viscosa TUFC12733]|uniref:NAD(P)-binding protein n=1 Tax=Calocera viscosa (strain TUFC12733) TaxID=1330018 RepID=A0A167RUQ7_CALVF|nr:NAD(P)-binding protein [Calocera viscosa TUFC12733]
MAPKVWLITGASSGFGRIMSELVLAAGDICVATSIDPPALADLFPKYGKERLRLVNTDVTQLDEVQLAFNIAEQAFGGVDFVYSNAGITATCEVESTPDNVAKDLFDVNFWGAANVMREAVRFFREVNGPERGGKLLQMTSGAGIAGWPGLGYYVATKHAVEGLTKTLVQELNPEWNIQVMMIEPGFMRTPILNLTKDNMLDPLPAYAGGAGVQTRLALQSGQLGGDPNKAMALLHKVAQMDKIPLHLPLGSDAIDFFRAAGAELTKAADEWESQAKETDA